MPCPHIKVISYNHHQIAVAWDDFDDKFRLDKKVVDDNNIFGSAFEWWKRQEDFEIKRSDAEDRLPYPLIDHRSFDSGEERTSGGEGGGARGESRWSKHGSSSN